MPLVSWFWVTESDIGKTAYPQTVLEEIRVGDKGSGSVATDRVQSKYVNVAYHAIVLEMLGRVAEEISK